MRNTGMSDRRSTASATEPKSSRPSPLRPCVVIAIRSAPASRAPARISSAGAPRRTILVTRTPFAPSSTAIGAKYSSASRRRFSTSSISTRRDPSTTEGGIGTRTRRSTTSMSRGPAISRMKGMIPSATIEPSSGTSARLYTGGLFRRRGTPLGLDRRAVGADDEDGRPGTAQHGLGHAAEDQAPKPAPPVRGHHDHVNLVHLRCLDDCGRGRSVPDVGLDVLGATVAEPFSDRVEVLLGLPDRGDLGVDRVGARQKRGFGGAQQAKAPAVGDRHRLRERRLGQDRSVQRNQDLVELHEQLLPSAFGSLNLSTTGFVSNADARGGDEGKTAR